MTTERLIKFRSRVAQLYAELSDWITNYHPGQQFSATHGDQINFYFDS